MMLNFMNTQVILMTKEQILQLVKEHFQEGGVRDDGSCSEYYGDPDAFVKFARKVISKEYSQGYDDGYGSGYDQGCYEATGGQ